MAQGPRRPRIEISSWRTCADDQVSDSPAAKAGAGEAVGGSAPASCVAVAAPFHADALYEEVRSAAPFAPLSRTDFDAALNFVATGGYALKSYDRFARLRQLPVGRQLHNA